MGKIEPECIHNGNGQERETQSEGGSFLRHIGGLLRLDLPMHGEKMRPAKPATCAFQRSIILNYNFDLAEIHIDRRCPPSTAAKTVMNSAGGRCWYGLPEAEMSRGVLMPSFPSQILGNEAIQI